MADHKGLKRNDSSKKTLLHGKGEKKRKKRGFFGKLKRAVTAPVKAAIGATKQVSKSLGKAARGDLKGAARSAVGARDKKKEPAKRSVAAGTALTDPKKAKLVGTKKGKVLASGKAKRTGAQLSGKAGKAKRVDPQVSPNTQSSNKQRRAQDSPNTQAGITKRDGSKSKKSRGNPNLDKRSFAKSSGIKRGTREFRQAFKSRKR